jgi:hypothetical protein
MENAQNLEKTVLQSGMIAVLPIWGIVTESASALVHCVLFLVVVVKDGKWKQHQK